MVAPPTGARTPRWLCSIRRRRSTLRAKLDSDRSQQHHPSAQPEANIINFTVSDSASHHALIATLQIVDAIGLVDERELPADPDHLAPRGTPLSELVAGLPESPITLAETLRAALTSTRGSLETLSEIFRSGEDSRIIALTSHARSALLGASRVVFVLGPLDPDERLRNALTVLRQEASSFGRYLDAVVKVRRVEGLKPPEPFASSMTDSISSFLGGDKAAGEWRSLSQLAPVVGDALTRSGLGSGRHADELAEHITYMWHAYSGEAHGYSWPRLIAGDFVADFRTIASVAQLAFGLTIEFTSAD